MDAKNAANKAVKSCMQELLMLEVEVGIKLQQE
jgi:hypothetical protein